MSWLNKNHLILVLVGWLALGCSAIAQKQEREPVDTKAKASVECQRDIKSEISALVDRAPLVLADLKVGTDGSADAELASALGVANTPREIGDDGLEFPSAVEDAVTQLLRDNICYRAFDHIVSQGEEEVSGQNRAVMQIEIPLVNMQALTVEYAPGKFRRNYLFQLSLGFELRDRDGKVVFAHSHGENYRRTCFWEGTAAANQQCLDLQEQPIDPISTWRQVIDDSVFALLDGVSRELVNWRRLLAEQSGAFYDRRYSSNRKVDGVQARNRTELAAPYLLVQTPAPRLNINGLLAGLNERGYTAQNLLRNDLQNYYNILFRSFLDHSLREAIVAKGDVENTRIVLLSDAQSEAFQNAMIITCAEQSRGFNREDCLAPVKLIESLCDAAHPDFGQGRNSRGDTCMLASLAFGNSLTRTNNESLGRVRDAQQRIQAAAYLRAPENGRDRATLQCRNPESRKIAGHLVGASETYYRIDTEQENDDGIYLQDAAVRVMKQQADCMAQHLLVGYHAILQAK